MVSLLRTSVVRKEKGIPTETISSLSSKKSFSLKTGLCVNSVYVWGEMEREIQINILKTNLSHICCFLKLTPQEKEVDEKPTV